MDEYVATHSPAGWLPEQRAALTRLASVDLLCRALGDAAAAEEWLARNPLGVDGAVFEELQAEVRRHRWALGKLNTT